MPYNKNQFRKVNDKKVLHKVKSHWVAVSLSLLMALGGTAVAGQAVHADNNINLNNQNSVNHQVGSPDSKLSFTDDNGTMSDYQAPKRVSAVEDAPETQTGATERITPQYVNRATDNIVPRYVNASNDADNSLSNKINSLEQPANMGSDIPAPSSASDSAANNVVPKRSASNQSASNSVSSSAASSSAASSSDDDVSYVSGDNGSAASYHAKASAEQSLYQVNSSLAEQYINSLNSNFGTKNASLKNNYSTINSKYQHDQSIANTYFNIANNPDYSQEVTSLAAANNQTASNYVQSISYQASSFANNLSQGNSLKSQMAVVNSYAQLINNLHSNSDLRTDYSLKAQSADYALSVENAYSAGFSSVASALNNASSIAGSAMLSAVVGSMNASASNAIANINIDRDNSVVNSLASALGYGNNTFSALNSLNSYAAAFKTGNNGNLILKAQDGTYSNIAYNANDSDNIYSLLDDISIKNTYGSKANSYSDVISSAKDAQTSLSSAISSASANVQSESSKYSSVNSTAAFYDALNDPQVGLNNIFGSEVAVSNASAVDVNTVNSTVSDLLGQYAGSNAPSLASVGLSPATIQSAVSLAVPNLVNAVAQNDNLIDANGNITDVQALVSSLGHDAKTIQSYVDAGVTDLQSKGQNDPVVQKLLSGGMTFAQLQNAIDSRQQKYPEIYRLSQIILPPIVGSMGNTTFITPGLASLIVSGQGNNIIHNALSSFVSAPATSHIIQALEPQTQISGNLLNRNSYSAAFNAIKVYAGIGQNNLAQNASTISSVANSASSAANDAASASAAYDSTAGVGTALAGSLLGSYDSIVYNDQQSLSAAQSSLTDFYNQYAPGYTSASATATSASSAEPIDAKLAQAYGMHVYNYAPKYITAIKDVTLQSSLGSNNSEPLTTIKRGRDRVQVNGVGFDRNGNTYYAVTYNGQNGYVTADPNATKNSYLFATPNNRATVTFVRNSYEYNSVAFNKKTIVKPIKAGEQRSGVIVSEDGNYGGWTRIRLDNGDYITANTSWIDIDLNNNNSNNNNHSNSVPQNKVNFV